MTTVTLQPGPEGQDLWIANWYSYNDNYGVNDAWLTVVASRDINFALRQQYSLIHFDLADTNAPTEVTSATLRLYRFDTGAGPVTGSMIIDELHTQWTEQYGWYDYGLNYTTIGTTTQLSFGWIEIDVTAAVVDWLTDPSSNYGLQLRPNGETSVFGDWNYFVSSDATGDLAQFRPELVINYGMTTYTYETINFGRSAWGYGINDNGQVVGFTIIDGDYYGRDSHFYGFLYSGGTSTLLPEPLAPSNGTDAYGINDAGQIVGDFSNGTIVQGYLYDGSQFTTGLGRQALDINNNGDIVGDASLSVGFVQYYQGPTITFSYNALAALSASIDLTSAEGINNNGEVVGYFHDTNGYHGFTYLNGHYDTIPDAALKFADAAPGQTFATDINNAGWIVGYYYDPSGIAHGFLDINGTYQEIGEDLHATTGVFAEGINDAGQIVGYYNDGSGTHAFLATVSINQPPVISAPVISSVTEDDPQYVLDLLQFASDPDNDVLHVANVSGLDAGMTLEGDRLRIDPSAYNSLGVDEGVIVIVDYQVIDGNGGSVPQTALVTITGVNDTPVAAADSAVVQRGSEITIDVLANDYDPDDGHDALRVTTINGQVAEIDRPIEGKHGTLTLSSAGTFVYLADRNLGSAASTAAVDVFDYTVNDGHVGGDASGKLAVQVTNSNSTVIIGGTLAADLAKAIAQIRADALAANNEKKLVEAYHLDFRENGALVMRIAEDIAAVFDSQGTFRWSEGYINPENTNQQSNSWKQCTALVVGLDDDIGFPVANWTNVGSSPIVLNGSANPAIIPGMVLPIATFDAINHYDGRHAAIFLGYGSVGEVDGFFMFDQYIKSSETQPAHPAEVRFRPFEGADYWVIDTI